MTEANFDAFQSTEVKKVNGKSVSKMKHKYESPLYKQTSREKNYINKVITLA